MVRWESHGDWGTVQLEHVGRMNAMNRSMWKSLRQCFESIGRDPALRCVVVQGRGGHFCAGGDISEYPGFRFDPESLRAFHEDDVWGALQAMLDCDVPLLACIEGNCMGAGVEIASCCDLRVASESARFGAPIARLGFPMAPRELALVARVVGDSMARAMLLGAQVLDAPRLCASGFLLECVPTDTMAARRTEWVQRLCQLAPEAARANKRTLRALNLPFPLATSQDIATNNVATTGHEAFSYADSAEHREGIAAFLEKRPAQF